MKTAQRVARDESELWANFDPSQWEDSVANRGDKRSFFDSLYDATAALITRYVRECEITTVIEVGVGTGDVLERVVDELPSRVRFYGLDINPHFVERSRQRIPAPNAIFECVDCSRLSDWIRSSGVGAPRRDAAGAADDDAGAVKNDADAGRMLIFAVNNTISIMPEQLRAVVIDQMIRAAGAEGLVLVSYWNNEHFASGVRDFYMKNPQLCGNVIAEEVDYAAGTLRTDTNYTSHWPTLEEVKRWYLSRSYAQARFEKIDKGIFVTLTNLTAREMAIRDYYDAEQTYHFYRDTWGARSLHIGMYTRATRDASEVRLAGQRTTRKLLSLCAERLEGGIAARVVDLGAGYGNTLLDLMAEHPNVRGTLVDISRRACEEARKNARAAGMEPRLQVIESSYLSSGLPAESFDVCISLDAFLHIGPDFHTECLAEAYRLLRPGGRLLFSDVMQSEYAYDLKPIYRRVNLAMLGTIGGYLAKGRQVGFEDVTFSDCSEHIAPHFQSVKNIFQEVARDGRYSPQVYKSITSGLSSWISGAQRGDLIWGFYVMHKPRRDAATAPATAPPSSSSSSPS